MKKMPGVAIGRNVLLGIAGAVLLLGICIDAARGDVLIAHVMEVYRSFGGLSIFVVPFLARTYAREVFLKALILSILLLVVSIALQVLHGDAAGDPGRRVIRDMFGGSLSFVFSTAVAVGVAYYSSRGRVGAGAARSSFRNSRWLGRRARLARPPMIRH